MTGKAHLGLLLTVGALAWALPSQAADTTAAFLKIGVGARPIGMGSAFAAVADDISAVHWNPAGLAQLRSREAGAMDARLFEDTRLDFVGYAHPLKQGTLAVSSVYLSQGSIEGRGANRERLGSYQASDTAVALSFARLVTGGLSLGASAKLLQSRIADATASGYAVDFGAHLRTSVPGLSLGAAVSNLGPGLRFLEERSRLPLTFSGGAALRLPVGLTLTAEYRSQVYDRRAGFGFGTELDLLSAVSVRAGYLTGLGGQAKGGRSRIEDAGGVGAGLGLKLGRFRLDYAFTPMGELGSAQRISLGARF